MVMTNDYDYVCSWGRHFVGEEQSSFALFYIILLHLSTNIFEMVASCCAFNCTNRFVKGSGIQFFRYMNLRLNFTYYSKGPVHKVRHAIFINFDTSASVTLCHASWNQPLLGFFPKILAFLNGPWDLGFFTWPYLSTNLGFFLTFFEGPWLFCLAFLYLLIKTREFVNFGEKYQDFVVDD